MEEAKTVDNAVPFQTQRIMHDAENPTVLNAIDPDLEPLDDGTLPVTANMRFNSDVRMTAADKNDSGMSSIQNGKKKRRLGRWTVKEHERFLEALRIYGKDWTMIQRHVKSRQVTNIRAHAQKFLLKLVKVVEQKEKMSSSNENSLPLSGDPEADVNTA